jgi:hypothetical protein
MAELTAIQPRNSGLNYRHHRRGPRGEHAPSLEKGENPNFSAKLQPPPRRSAAAHLPLGKLRSGVDKKQRDQKRETTQLSEPG